MQAMFGWVGSHTSGLLADGMEIIDDADSAGEKSIEDKYTGHSSKAPLLVHSAVIHACFCPSFFETQQFLLRCSVMLVGYSVAVVTVVYSEAAVWTCYRHVTGSMTCLV